jgi:hypothetical protein
MVFIFTTQQTRGRSGSKGINPGSSSRADSSGKLFQADARLRQSPLGGPMHTGNHLHPAQHPHRQTKHRRHRVPLGTRGQPSGSGGLDQVRAPVSQNRVRAREAPA